MAKITVSNIPNNTTMVLEGPYILSLIYIALDQIDDPMNPNLDHRSTIELSIF